MSCGAPHPTVMNVFCGKSGVHPNHKAFDGMQWHDWPNDNYRPPATQAYESVARRAREAGADQRAAALVRASDPDTSHQAARAMAASDLTTKQAFVWNTLKGFPAGLTHAELVVACQDRLEAGATMADSTIRTRCRELATFGLVFDSGEKRKTASGQRSIVWVAAD